MGSAKAKGAGAGALTGAAAGSTFGPIGTVVGGVGGAALGFFGSEEPPEYQQPPVDPSMIAFMEQQKQQKIDATQIGVGREAASLKARYGTAAIGGSGGGAASPTSADPGSLLARYGAMLAAAGR